MMPRYYKDKIYSDEEKELLWLQKLDKGETWVMGEKCKIDSDEYKNLLSYYREQAKQIHGDNIALWKEKQYWRRLEKQRNIYRKRKHMEEYIDRRTAEAINSHDNWRMPILTYNSIRLFFVSAKNQTDPFSHFY